MEKAKNRIWELDFLRGLSILLMVFDHLMYDLKNLPSWFSNYYQVESGIFPFLQDFASLYWNSWLRANFHFVFVAIFLLVSGISFNFSRSNLKRGMKFLIVAVLISAITMPIEAITGLEIGIVFGIIHLFAFGTLLTYLLRKIWDNDVFLLVIGLLIITGGVLIDWLRVPYYQTLTFPKLLEVIVGLKGYGADYFGLMPYAGVIMVGSAIGKVLYPTKQSLLPSLDKKWNRPFVFAGQKSLIIFVSHQLILIALIYLFGFILGYQL